MVRAGHHEEPVEITHALEPAIRGNDALEVVDGTAGEDERVAPAVIGDHLGAMATEGGKIRIVGADDLVELLLRFPESCREAGDGKAVPVEAGVVLDPKAPMVEGDREGQSDRRRGRGRVRESAEIRAGLESV